MESIFEISDNENAVQMIEEINDFLRKTIYHHAHQSIINFRWIQNLTYHQAFTKYYLMIIKDNTYDHFENKITELQEQIKSKYVDDWIIEAIMIQSVKDEIISQFTHAWVLTGPKPTWFRSQTCLSKT
jgi:elongation factor P--beta-lysine ligase